jgi:hypothetical protein
MKWERVGAYGMRSGEYRVCKAFLDGCTLYGLYHLDALLCWCNDFDECKELAEAHASA